MNAETVRLRIEVEDAIKERDHLAAVVLKLTADAGDAEAEVEWTEKRYHEISAMNFSLQDQRADLRRQLEQVQAENRRITAQFFAETSAREQTIRDLRERVRAAEGQMGQTIATSLESIKTLTAERDEARAMARKLMEYLMSLYIEDDEDAAAAKGYIAAARALLAATETP